MRHRSTDLDTNCLSVVMHLVSFWMSCIQQGEGTSLMTRIFSRLVSIPLWSVIYPRNLIDYTSNKHFLGLSFMLYFFSVMRVSSRSAAWLSLLQLFIIISSTYTFIFQPMCDLKTLFTKFWYGTQVFFRSKEHHFVATHASLRNKGCFLWSGSCKLIWWHPEKVFIKLSKAWSLIASTS